MAFKQLSVTMATEGGLDGQALEIVRRNTAHKREGECSSVCACLQSGGEVHRGETWVSHSRGGQRGPLLLLPPEPHADRWYDDDDDNNYVYIHQLTYKGPAAVWKDCAISRWAVQSSIAARRQNNERRVERIKECMFRKWLKHRFHVQSQLKDTILFISTTKAKADVSPGR